MGDQETPELVVVEKIPEAEDMQEQESSSTMGMSTLSLDCAAYESPCAKCGFSPAAESNSVAGSLKRNSPSHDDHHQPKPKKLFLDAPTPTDSSPKNLRRCVSDPCKPPLPLSQSPQHSLAASAPIPNNLLRRCVSDPCKPPLAPTNVKPSPFSSASPTDIALAPSTVRRSIVDITPPNKNDSETDCESYVTVERIGETFRIHVKCQCGRGCHLLVDGGDYYYKLM